MYALTLTKGERDAIEWVTNGSNAGHGTSEIMKKIGRSMGCVAGCGFTILLKVAGLAALGSANRKLAEPAPIRFDADPPPRRAVS